MTRLHKILNEYKDDPYILSRTFVRKRRNIPPLQAYNEHHITDSEKSLILARTFAKNFSAFPIPNHITNSTHEYLAHHFSQPFNKDPNPITFLPPEVRQIIKEVPKKKVPGFDKIPNFSLIHLPFNTILNLTKIINSRFHYTHYPDPWKITKIIPIPKHKKTPRDPKSYRPISLLSSLAKILDVLILKKVMEVVEEKNLLPHIQYGFRSHHSTSQQLFRVCEHLTTSINRGQSTGFVALDLEKAFDKVWHLGLHMKVHRQGFSDRMVHIIRSYLSNRTFRVVINQGYSPRYSILSGVPQVSALGPILYSLYTADIPKPQDRRTKLALYADDTAILTTSKNILLLNGLIQTQLDRLSRYYTTPLLSDYILQTLLPRFAQSLVSHTNPTLHDPLTPKFATHPKYPSLNYIYNP